MGKRLGDGWEARLPSAVLDAYDRWHLSTGYDTRLVGWLDGGMSEAKVAVVLQFEKNVIDRQAILKFLPKDGPGEVRRMRQALDHSPREFREAHLVELIGDAIPLDAWWMIQMEIAGGDQSVVQPLVKLRHHASLHEVCGIVVGSLLAEWNAARAHPPLPMTAGAYLQLLLGDRLEAGSALSTWAATRGLATERFVPDGDGGQALNPLALAHSDDAHSLFIRRGRAHGDLNVRNVLVHPDDPQGFKLIDYGGFAEDASLAYDPAYLLLSLAREWLGDFAVDSPIRHDLKVAIVTPDKSEAASVMGPKAVSMAFHGTAQSWANRGSFGDQWRAQALLSLIGCGLIFAGRGRLTDDVRQWFFDLSAYGTREYLRMRKELGWPSFQASVPSGGKSSVASVPRSRVEIDAWLKRHLPFMQRTFGNKDLLLNIVMELLDGPERFVCLAPYRMSGGMPGSAVIVVSDRYVRAIELDMRDRISDVTRVAHSEIGELRLYPDRRLGLLDTADVRIAGDTVELLVRGLLRDQAKDLLAKLEELTGLRVRESVDDPSSQV